MDCAPDPVGVHNCVAVHEDIAECHDLAYIGYPVGQDLVMPG